MSKNNLILGLILALLTGGAYYYETVIVAGQRQEIARSKKLVDFQVKDVQEFTLERDSGEKYQCRRRSETAWDILDPLKAPGDAEMIDNILDSVRTADIERVLIESAKESDLADYGFDKPAFKIELHIPGGKATVLIGSQTPTQKSYYARLKGAPRVLIVPYSIVYGLKKDLFTIRDKSVISLEVKEVERLELEYGKASLVLEREGELNWNLKKPAEKELDRYEVEAFIRKLDYLQTRKFLDAVDQTKAGWKKEYGFDDPPIVIKATIGPGQETKRLIVGKKEQDGRLFYVRRPGRKTIYEIDMDSFNALRKKPFDFEKKFIFSLERDKIKRIEIKKPEGTVVLKREGDSDNWTIIRPRVSKADTRAVDKFLGMMTSKVIKGYVEKIGDEVAGFDRPKAVIALTLDGEKEPRILTVGKARNEKLGYAKTGEKQFLIGLETAAVFLRDLKAKETNERKK
ncbi:MAG: DUF4340 domain-containing protein [bacterium]